MVRHIAAALAVLSSLGAATLERLTLDEMIQKSTAIVRGRVASPYASFRGNVIYTHFPVRVTEQLKGASGASVDVVTPGGTVGQVRQTYSGVPQLTEGKEYVLFLWTGPSGMTQVIGFTQGVFSLPKDASTDQAVAEQQPTTETVLDRGSGQVARSPGIAVSLGDLRRRISNWVGGLAQ
jgi:hypothetical protein